MNESSRCNRSNWIGWQIVCLQIWTNETTNHSSAPEQVKYHFMLPILTCVQVDGMLQHRKPQKFCSPYILGNRTACAPSSAGENSSYVAKWANWLGCGANWQGWPYGDIWYGTMFILAILCSFFHFIRRFWNHILI